MPKREDVIIQALRDINQKMDRQHESTNERLVAIEKVQVKQEENLGEHMRRTELLEAGQASIRIEIEPLKKHKAFIEGALKGIGILATAISLICGVIKIVSYIIH